MKKHSILWTGSDKQHCLVLMKAYSECFTSFYTEAIGNKTPGNADAVILVPSPDEYCEKYKSVFSFSSEFNIPVIMLSKAEQFLSASIVGRPAQIVRGTDEKLIEQVEKAISGAGRMTAALFTGNNFVSALLLSEFEGERSVKLMTYGASPAALQALSRKRLSPCLFILGEDAAYGENRYFFEAFTASKEFGKTPFAVIRWSEKLAELGDKRKPAAIFRIDTNTDIKPLVMDLLNNL